MSKPILISGIQPTGRLHLGNYLGALKNFVDLQNSGKYECYFFVADLHALTENPEAKDLSENIINLTADFLAAGLDPKKSLIFLQSAIHHAPELAWIFDTIAPLGDLSRMTQFKDKVEQLGIKLETSKKEIDEAIKNALPKGTHLQAMLRLSGDINVGLLLYPVLMAADILLYDAQVVPVGEDQLQHLELTRTLARKFNGKFGKTFVEPRALMTSMPRLMSLDDPTKKMSKSRPAGCLFIDDSPEEIEQKIKTAVTDSGSEVKYDEKNKPAISNLMMIYAELAPSSLRGAESDEAISQKLQAIEKKFAGKGYADFKKSLAEVVSNYFADFRKKKSALLGVRTSDVPNIEKVSRGAERRGNLSRLVIASKAKQSHQKLKEVLNSGSKKAEKVAAKKIAEVKEKIGLAL